jgi:hypothetical protein
LKEVDELLKGLSSSVVWAALSLPNSMGYIGHRLPGSHCSITGRRCRSARGTRIKSAPQIPRIYAIRGNRYASCGLRESTHPGEEMTGHREAEADHLHGACQDRHAEGA